MATVTFQQTALATNNTNVYTFSNQNIGTASDDRIVVVGVTAKVGLSTSTFTTVTIGGTNGKILAQKINGNNAVISCIVALKVPTGTTATIVATNNGTCGDCGIAVWTLTGVDIETAHATTNAIVTAGTSLSSSLAVQAGGIVIAASGMYNPSGTTTLTNTWTNLTEDYDSLVENTGSNARSQSGASTTSATAQTLTVTDTISASGDGAMVVASFSPKVSYLGEYLGAGSAVTQLLCHMQGNSKDLSGNYRLATDTSMTYGLSSGYIGQGASFNGTTSKISYPDSSSLSPSNLTVSLWVKPTSLPTSGNTMALLDKRDNTSGTGGWLLQFSNNGGTQEIVLLGNNTGAPTANVAHTTSTSAWTHILVTKVSTANAKVYVNGVLKGTDNGTWTMSNFATPLLLGARSASAFYSGIMDEVIIENVIWTAPQIQQYYTYAKGRYGII